MPRRKRRKSPRALRFADLQVGAVLLWRHKSRSITYPKHPIPTANDDEQITIKEYATFAICRYRWFDPVQGFDDPVAGEMAGVCMVNPNGEIAHPSPWTLRGLAMQGFHYATPEQSELVLAFVAERKALIADYEAGRITADHARLRAMPYRELVRNI